MKRKLFMTTLLTLLLSITAFAQKLNCKGTVIDVHGEPVIGATVIQKGGTKTNGVITDLDGHFTLDVDQGSIISVTYIGYKTYEGKAGANMHIVLQEEAQTLNDVVVIGYGVQKKSVVTASIAKVDGHILCRL